MTLAKNVRHNLRGFRPLYAALGATDLAVQRLRELGAQASGQDSTDTRGKDVDRLLLGARQVPGLVLGQAVTTLTRTQEQYDGFAARGAQLARRAPHATSADTTAAGADESVTEAARPVPRRRRTTTVNASRPASAGTLRSVEDHTPHHHGAVPAGSGLEAGSTAKRARTAPKSATPAARTTSAGKPAARKPAAPPSPRPTVVPPAQDSAPSAPVRRRPPRRASSTAASTGVVTAAQTPAASSNGTPATSAEVSPAAETPDTPAE